MYCYITVENEWPIHLRKCSILLLSSNKRKTISLFIQITEYHIWCFFHFLLSSLASFFMPKETKNCGLIFLVVMNCLIEIVTSWLCLESWWIIANLMWLLFMVGLQSSAELHWDFQLEEILIGKVAFFFSSFTLSLCYLVFHLLFPSKVELPECKLLLYFFF